MLKPRTRRRLILGFGSVILCGAVVAVVHRGRLSIWLLAQRSEAIAYADFPAGTDGTHADIREIWKQARGPEKLSVGTAIAVGPPFSVLAHDPPEGVILFFDGRSSREFAHLAGNTRLFFRGDHLWWPGRDIELTLADMRALCTWHVRI